MKILLIGFHKYDDNMYPHLRCFIDHIAKHDDMTYFHFRERGYFAEHLRKRPFSPGTWIRVCVSLLSSVADSLRLLLRYRNYDKVIAIDHYAYALASLIFRNREVIMWSHDIISHDSRIYSNPFVRGFMKVCSQSLAKNGRIIIQDEDRLALLKKSLHLTGRELDVFFMPVCLERTDIAKRELSSSARPRFLQSGGIGTYRSSDKLLEHYQGNFNFYRLYFHGFIFQEIKDQLTRCTVQPMVSSRTVNPTFIYQLNDYCDIGFVSYEDEENLNFFYIARASGQLVEFLRIGMPVVVMGKNNLKSFVEEQGVGIGIADMSELNHAIRILATEYDKYSGNCFQTFDRYFNCEKYIHRIMEWL